MPATGPAFYQGMKKAAFVLLILGAVTGGFYFYRV